MLRGVSEAEGTRKGRGNGWKRWEISWKQETVGFVVSFGSFNQLLCFWFLFLLKPSSPRKKEKALAEIQRICREIEGVAALLRGRRDARAEQRQAELDIRQVQLVQDVSRYEDWLVVEKPHFIFSTIFHHICLGW
jgi:hypothetical protein